MHCTIYTLNEGFEPVRTKCYCDHSKEALMKKAYYKSYHAAFFGVCFSFKNINPWIDHSLNRIIDDHKMAFYDYLIPVLLFFSNYFLQSLKDCMFLPYLNITVP